ncbi:MAG: beta-xylosidase [Acidobacteriaceae bacterium]|nr:beta-xylosidase [Acidobacteriaceae bacterium]
MKFVPIVICVASAASFGQKVVTVRVDAAHTVGDFKPVWNYFGYDEPNYTYAPNGRKLIRELAALCDTPVHIRTHNLLTTGDGVAALKWGSTNAYTENASGKPVYNWTVVDKILSTYLEAGAKPFVEIGFMPEALSTHPEPYRHTFPKGDIFTGWVYPPKDYQRWSALVVEMVAHCVKTYGRTETASWDWEVWNEPDIGYWHGTPDEYDRLYDYTSDAVKRALPEAHVGGPATTGPASPKAAAFLRQFLEHCTSGKNYVTQRVGAPLDFISYHAKGRPEWIDGHVRMGIAAHMRDVSAGLAIIHEFPKLRKLPIVLSESDPEGCAACQSPRNAYRNGTLYPAYVAVALKTILELTQRENANLAGILTWAFEFEDQPYFAGFRSLATNGIDKPVLNIFRMAGLMRGDRIAVESDGAVPLNAIVQNGVRAEAVVDGLASQASNQVSVLLWNYRDDDISGPPAEIHLEITGLPAKRVLVRHYRIDQTHSNAYTAWKQMGSPETPTDEQHRALERAGQLEQLQSPEWMNSGSGTANFHFSLPLQAISLVQFSW